MTSSEIDSLLRYRPGRARRLAKDGRLPHVELPDGEIRFDQAEIEKLLDAGKREGAPA